MPKFTTEMRAIILFIVLFISGATAVVAQSNESRKSSESTTMVLEGRVITDKREPVSGVNIEGPMGRYATTDIQGYFKIPANLGDEIIIRRSDFETVYYKIKSNDDIEIQVVNDASQKNQLKSLSYETLLDSAQVYLKKDAQKTADFLIAALSNNPRGLTAAKEARAYEKLGDLYLFNKQADLAITNFKAAIKSQDTPQRQLKLAESLQSNGNYQEAIKTLEAIFSTNNTSRNKTLKKTKSSSGTSTTLGLTHQQVIKAYTTLGNAYQKTNNAVESLKYFKMALKVAQDHNLTSLTPVLNTNIANAYNQTGQIATADSYYNDAINESKNNSVISNVATQSATADFYNSNQQYEKEIALRRSNIALIDKAKDVENSSFKIEAEAASDDMELADEIMAEEVSAGIMAPVSNTAPYSKQKEQLKIAEAYKATNKFAEAIESYESSFNEASTNEDLDTKKEAARNLAKLYRENGNNSKSLKYNEIYIETVDLLYAQKEQEIAVNTRKAQDLLNRQTRILTLEKDRELTENRMALVNTERELTQQVNNRQRWIIYSLAALTLLLITLAYFMWRNNQQQRINNRLLALKSLRSQMNPHFIFNALNSVNSYIAMNDERAANKYLADFSKLMRSVLENSELDFIPLSKETELLGLYLKLEHERFKDKFDYELIIDPLLEGTALQVPPMLLQPIIENAVWHGLRYKDEKGFLKVAFAKAGNEILVTITDNGIGRAKSEDLKTDHQKKRESKGLGNVENRLALLNELHDCHIEMTVNDAHLSPDIGTEVVVKMNVPS
ncbi:MAG: tetratricopeptide repeat-containing sensor histidine kinase [Nonlabens sp.]|uniref:tetratricopeptide repeat-containing sensor histidine kinase n=1 Tax=Nonlabens sp. TaxID=1888209 RepID=UPI003EF292C7